MNLPKKGREYVAKKDPNHPYGGWPRRWNRLGDRTKNQVNDVDQNEKRK